jgi:hypothetical protein
LEFVANVGVQVHDNALKFPNEIRDPALRPFLLGVVPYTGSPNDQSILRGIVWAIIPLTLGSAAVFVVWSGYPWPLSLVMKGRKRLGGALMVALPLSWMTFAIFSAMDFRMRFNNFVVPVVVWSEPTRWKPQWLLWSVDWIVWTMICFLLAWKVKAATSHLKMQAIAGVVVMASGCICAGLAAWVPDIAFGAWKDMPEFLYVYPLGLTTRVTLDLHSHLFPLIAFVPAFVWAATVLLISASIRRIADRHFSNRDFCHNCGYDLRASPDRCPECGKNPGKRK